MGDKVNSSPTWVLLPHNMATILRQIPTWALAGVIYLIFKDNLTCCVFAFRLVSSDGFYQNV